jgi:hypothetical protein
LESNQRSDHFQIAKKPVERSIFANGQDDLFKKCAALAKKFIRRRLIAATEVKHGNLMAGNHPGEEVGDHAPTAMSRVQPRGKRK